MLRPVKVMLFLPVLVIALAGCSSLPSPTATPLPTVTLPPTASPTPPPTATVNPVPRPAQADPESRGHIRIIQAAPDSSAVDVYLEQALIASRLGMGDFTNPVDVAAGDYALQVVPVAARPNTQILADARLTVERERSYLVLIGGTPDALSMAIYEEDTSPVPEGRLRLNFLNATPRSAAYTPQVDDQMGDSALDFGQMSAAMTIDAGEHRLAFGTGNAPAAESESELAARQLVTAILLGRVGGSDLRILLLNTPLDRQGHVRVLHAGGEIGPVDVYLDDQRIADGLTFRSATAWLDQRARTYRLRITESGVSPDAAALVDTRFSLNPDRDMEILLMADQGQPVAQVYAHSLAPTPALAAHLVVVNAAPQHTIVYAIAATERLTAIPPVPYGQTTSVLEIAAGPVTLLWRSGEGTDAQLIERAGEVVFEEGHTYTYVVTGSDGNPFIVDTAVGQDTATISALTGITRAAAAGDRADLRVINALSEAVNLRVRLDNIEIVNNLPARQAGPYTSLAKNTYTLRIGQAGASANAPDFYIDDLSLLDRNRVSLLVYGSVEQMQVRLLPDYDRPVQQGQSVLRIIHAIAGQDGLSVAVDLPDVVGGESVQTPQVNLAHYETGTISPGEAGPFINLPRGTYDIRVSRVADSEVVAIVPRLALESLTTYDLLLLPDASGEGYAIELLDGPSSD